MDIQIDASFKPDPNRREETLSKPLGFGQFFTDRIFTVKYVEGKGWHDARIGPFQDFSLSPAAAVLHYGQAVFEGQKAYARGDGEIALFRPEMNARRYARSSARLCMPALPEADYVQAVEALVDAERDWVPRGDQQSLYLRPFCVATEALMGVRPAREYLFAVLATPVGAYYESGFKPVRILVSDELVRAARGGTGEAKAAGNYAASLLAGQRAAEADCAQVLWLDAAERRYVEEIGAMNIMFVIDDVLVTPPLGGSILPGVTRDSILQLAKDQGMKVEERPVEIDTILADIEAGRCTESFGCGTAAVVTAIGTLVKGGKAYELPNPLGPVAKRMFDTLTGIQWGRGEDPHGWSHKVPRR